MKWEPYNEIGWVKDSGDGVRAVVVIDDKVLENDTVIHSPAYDGFKELLPRYTNKLKAVGFFQMMNITRDDEFISKIDKWISDLGIQQSEISFFIDIYGGEAGVVLDAEVGIKTYSEVKKQFPDSNLKYISDHPLPGYDRSICFVKSEISSHYYAYKELPDDVKIFIGIEPKMTYDAVKWNTIRNIAAIACFTHTRGCKYIKPAFAHHLKGGQKCTRDDEEKIIELRNVFAKVKEDLFRAVPELNNCRDFINCENWAIPPLRSLIQFVSKFEGERDIAGDLSNALTDNLNTDKIKVKLDISPELDMLWFDYITIIKAIKSLNESFRQIEENNEKILKMEINVKVYEIVMDNKPYPDEIKAEFKIKQLVDRNVYNFPEKTKSRKSVREIYYGILIDKAKAHIDVKNGELEIVITGKYNESISRQSDLSVYNV